MIHEQFFCHGRNVTHSFEIPNKATEFVLVLVSLGCRYEVPQTGLLKPQERFVSQF